MASHNRVILLGNMTRDAEVRYTQSGQAVASFGLAVNDRRKDGEQWVDDPVFVDCTAWGKTGEVVGEYGGKGKQLLVEGRLKLDKWTAQDGSPRSKLKVVAERVQLIGSRQEREERPMEPDSHEPAPALAEDDIPF